MSLKECKKSSSSKSTETDIRRDAFIVLEIHTQARARAPAHALFICLSFDFSSSFSKVLIKSRCTKVTQCNPLNNQWMNYTVQFSLTGIISLIVLNLKRSSNWNPFKMSNNIEKAFIEWNLWNQYKNNKFILRFMSTILTIIKSNYFFYVTCYSTLYVTSKWLLPARALHVPIDLRVFIGITHRNR